METLDSGGHPASSFLARFCQGFAESMKDTKNPTTASGKTSHASVTFSKQAVAKTIVDGTTRGLGRIRDASFGTHCIFGSQAMLPMRRSCGTS